MKPIDYSDAIQLADDLTAIKEKLGRLGLFETMHALDIATKKIGFEIADHMTEHSRDLKKQREKAA